MKVTVIRDNHKHAGKPCKKGDVIDVQPHEADWLAAQGVIEAPKSTAGVPAQKEGK